MTEETLFRKILCKFTWTSFFILLSIVTVMFSLTGLFYLNNESNWISSTNNEYSNGRTGIVPWWSFTIYTVGIVILSYYIGGVFNSQCISEDDYLANPLLKIKSQLTLLPITQLIRKSKRKKKNKVKLIVEELDTIDGINSEDPINNQRDLLIEAILESYIFPWYHRISNEKEFPSEAKLLLKLAFNNLREKLKMLDRNLLIIEGIQIIHRHWNEYCVAISKIKSPNDLLIEKFQLSHSFIGNADDLCEQYQEMLSILLPKILPEDLQCQILIKFISGIIAKNVFLYYTDYFCDPKKVNSLLVSLISSGNYVSDLSSNASGSNISTGPPSPIPCPASTVQNMFGTSILTNPPTSLTSPITISPTSTFQIPSDNVPQSSTSTTIGNVNDENSVTSPISSITLENTVVEAVASKGSIHHLLHSNVKKRTNEKTNSPLLLNSIQAALSGLLSATALPLLPEGSTFTNSATSSSKEQYGLENTSSQTENINESITKDAETVEYSKPASNSAFTTGLHKSLEECTLSEKKVACSSTNQSTKSLDENLSSTAVARQEEFDFGNSEFDSNPIESYSGCGPEKGIALPDEEPEDFAATIAKLRSLLEQRESQTNVMEKFEKPKMKEINQKQQQSSSITNSPVKGASTKMIRPSLDSQSSTSSLGSDCSAGTTHTQGSGSESERKLEKIDDEDECGDPVISQFFLNVAITKTESCGDSSNEQFTLYCIQYEGVYIEEGHENDAPKLVLRTTTVKRSFKEFLLLQHQLEESRIWRPHLRGIKTPNKWLNISFNQNAAIQRRNLLEKYLQQLCSHCVLGFSPELRHFMAYGEDGFQMFGLPPFAHSNSPRFNKLAKTFSGVLSSLRDSLPTFESELERSSNFTESNKGKKLLPSFLNFGEKNDGRKFGEDVLDDKAILRDEGDEREFEIKKQLESEDEANSSCSDEQEDDGIEINRIDSNLKTESSLDTVYPLASVVTKLLCDVLWLPQQRPHPASVTAVLSVSGKSLENYLQETFDILLSEESFVGYIESITASIQDWNNPSIQSNVDYSEVKDTFSVDDLKSCLKQRVPAWIRWMWGRSRLDLTIERLSECFQVSTLNQDCVLSIIELCFSKLSKNHENSIL